MKDILESIDKLFPIFAQNAAAALAALGAALLVFLVVKRWKEISKPGGGRMIFLSILAMLVAGAIVTFVFSPSLSPDLSGTITGFYEKEGSGYRSTVRSVSIRRHDNESGFHRVSYDTPQPFIKWINKLQRSALWGSHDCAHVVLGVEGKLFRSSDVHYYEVIVPLTRSYYSSREFLSGLNIDMAMSDDVPTALVKIASTGQAHYLQPPTKDGRPRHPIAKCDAQPANGRAGLWNWSLIAPAFAQTRFEPADVDEALKSSDYKRRLAARRALAKSISTNTAALAWAKQIIGARATQPDRLVANVLAALTDADVDAGAIDAATHRKILSYVADDDDMVRAAAVDFIRLRRTNDQGAIDGLLAGLADADGPRQQADRYGAALVSLYYHRGVIAFDDFHEKNAVAAYDRALLQFRAGITHVEKVSAAKQYRFALLHWGLSISHYVRYWRMPEPQRARSPLKAETLRSLAEIVRLTKDRPYSYPHHVRAATACLRDDGWSQTCLDIKIE